MITQVNRLGVELCSYSDWRCCVSLDWLRMPEIIPHLYSLFISGQYVVDSSFFTAKNAPSHVPIRYGSFYLRLGATGIKLFLIIWQILNTVYEQRIIRIITTNFTYTKMKINTNINDEKNIHKETISLYKMIRGLLYRFKLNFVFFLFQLSE